MKAWNVLYLLCLASLLPAEGTAFGLTLPQAQAQAEALNPSLRRLDAEVRAAKARAWEPLAGYLPRLDVTGQHLFTAQYGSMDISFPAFGFNDLAFPAAFPQDTLDVRAQWTLFDGLRGYRSWQAAGSEEKAARLERDFEAFHVRQQVAVLFYKALAARQLVDASRDNTATLEVHLRLAHDYENSGQSTHFGVLRVQAQQEEALATQQQAEDQAAMARTDLGTAIGLSRDSRALVGSLPVPRADQVPDSLVLDLDRRADLRALELRKRALESREAGLVSAWAPQVSVFADREYYRYGAFNPEILATNGFPDQEMTGVDFSWNLFNGGMDQAQRDDAEAQVLAAKDGIAGARLAALREFDSWKRRFRDSVRLYTARLRVLAQCDESVRLADLGLKAGTLTNSEVLDAELDLFRARVGVVQAQADAAEARLNIELLQGGPVRP